MMIGLKFQFFLFVALCESKRSLVPQAILQFVKSHYGEYPVKIEVIYNSDGIKILSETLKLLGEVKEIKVTNIYDDLDNTDLISISYDEFGDDENKFKKEEEKKKIFNDAIYIFDTIENYYMFELTKVLKFGSVVLSELRHLIYCEDLTSAGFQNYKGIFAFQIWLLVENEKISLNALMKFTERKCDQVQQVEINQFSILERKWMTTKFFNQKVENLNGCPLKIRFKDDDLPFSTYKFSEDKKVFTVEGVLVKMVEILATHLNFTIKYVTSKDITSDWLILIASESEYVQSDPIYSDWDVVLVPPGKAYTPWEKLFLPFDRDTWIWLGIVFVVAFAIIFLIKLSNSGSMYEFVIGSNVSTPTLNVIAMFMGIGQLFLPHRNVSRFLFINFILFCLIMRTAYQGKYFEFITCDVKKKPIPTVDELKEKNFTIYYEHYHILWQHNPKNLEMFQE